MSDRTKAHRPRAGRLSSATVGTALTLCAAGGIAGSFAAALPRWEQAAAGIAVCVLLGLLAVFLADR